MNPIDRKFTLIAFNPISGKQYTEEDGVFFLADDKAVVPALDAYIDACWHLGADENQITSATLLRERVINHQLAPSTQINIDRKFDILAVRISNGQELTNYDGMFFCAKDKAFISFLHKYLTACIELCDNTHQIAAVDLLNRVIIYQQTIGCKVPDINSQEEASRCIGGDVPITEQKSCCSDDCGCNDKDIDPSGSIGLEATDDRGLIETTSPIDESPFVESDSLPIDNDPPKTFGCNINSFTSTGSPIQFSESNGMKCQVRENPDFSSDDYDLPGGGHLD